MPQKAQTTSLTYESLVGKLVVFEGADGVGKTTLVKALEESLRTAKVNFASFAFPGSEEGTIGRLVYDIHHHPAEFGIAKVTAASLQTLHVAAHVDAIETRIVPALSAGAFVILDRFWWSTWVYGIINGVPRSILTPLIKFEKVVWGEIVPEAVVHLVRPDIKNTALDREYHRLAKRESRVVRVIRVEVHDRVEETLDATIRALLSERPKIRGVYNNMT